MSEDQVSTIKDQEVETPEIASPEPLETESPEQELALLVREKQRVMRQILQDAAQKKQAFEKEIAAAREVAQEPEVSEESIHVIAQEMHEIMVVRWDLTRGQCLRLNALNNQRKMIVNHASSESRKLFEEIETKKYELILAQNDLSEAGENVPHANLILKNHKRVIKPIRWLDRQFDRKGKIAGAEATVNVHQTIQGKIEVINKEILYLEREFNHKETLASKLNIISWEVDQEFNDNYLGKAVINREIIEPAKEKINSEVDTAINPLKTQLIDSFMEKVISPDLSKNTQRNEIRIMTPEEFQGLLIKKIRDSAIREFMPDPKGGIIFSSQGAEVLSIDAGELYTTDYDRTTQVFSLKNKQGKIVQTFPESDIMQMQFYRWQLKPGTEMGPYRVESWSAAELKLVLKNASGELKTIQGVDDLEQFEAETYGIQTENEVRTLTLSERDPHIPYVAMLDSHDNNTWTIRNESNGMITISREVGVFNLEQKEALIVDLRRLLESEDMKEKNRIAQEIFENSLYDNSDRKTGGLQLNINRYQRTMFAPILRLALLAPLVGDAQANYLEEALDYQMQLYSYSLNQKKFEPVLKQYFDANVQDFDFFLQEGSSNDPLSAEKQVLKRALVEAATQELNRNPDSEYLANYVVLLEYGNAEDFFQGVLRLLANNKMDLQVLANVYFNHPDQFQAKIQELIEKSPNLSQLTDLLEKRGKDVSFRQIADSENRQTTADFLAADLRQIVALEQTSPEEKRLIFQILLGKQEIDLNRLFEQDGSLNPAFAKELMMYLRTGKSEDSFRVSEVTPEMIEEFVSSLAEFYQAIEGGSLAALKPMLTNLDTFSFLARHPESMKQVLSLSQEAPDFIEMIADGGELENNREQLIKYLFADGNIIERAKSMVSIFAGNRSLPDKLMSFIDARLASVLQESKSEYPVNVERHGSAETVLFKDLTMEEKKQVLHSRLSASIAISRSPEAKQKATERNAQAPSTFRFRQGMYIHGLTALVAKPFIRNGNLCGEALGPSAKEDGFPFQVDYSHLSRPEEIEGKTLAETLSPFLCNAYGSVQENGRDTQILAVTDRAQSEWEQDTTYFANSGSPEHTLILGATPTTEVHYILLRDHEASLQRVIDACIEEEHYIPIYNLEPGDDRPEGQLLFTYQEYQARLAERKPFVDGAAFIQDESYLEPYDKAQASGMHRFTLKEHLLLATRLAAQTGESYGLNPEERIILEIAARLHDIGKDASGEQVVDNPVQAEVYLSQIQGLTADSKELILSLVRYDELLGDILQGKKKPDMFVRIFPDNRQQLMLLALYKADVKAIDGDEDAQSAYRQWQVDEKLQELGLERS